MFVKDHLTKIKELAKSNAPIQAACTSTLEFISKHLAGKETRRPYKEPLNLQLEKKSFDPSKDIVEQEWDYVVDTLLEAFHVACGAANPRVIENALEALLTLVEKNMVLGSVRSGKIGDLLAKCYEVKDDSVHMTILLTFGMLVAKPACELHDANLMTAIRISYNIFLITANSGIQKMAKEKLTEIARTLFQRLDGSTSISAPTKILASEASSSRPGTPVRAAAASRTGADTPITVEPRPPVPNGTTATTTTTVTTTDPSEESSDDDVETTATVSAVIVDKPSVAESGPAPTGEELATNFGIDDVSSTSQTVAGASTTNSSSATTSILVVPTSSALVASPISASSSSRSVAVDDVAFKDCIQAFRGFCKLSVKPMPESQASNIHSFDIRSRILCLELLNTIFEEDNLPTFKNNTRFVSLAIKKQLMDTIYVNLPSPISIVFRLTISLCVALIKEFRECLKPEVESLISCALLPVLESQNAPAAHRLAVIRALYVICKSPQCLADLFINYDCDLGRKDIFEAIAKTAARSAQRKLAENLAPEVVDQENLIKHLALKTSVCINIALVEWSKTLYEHPADAKAKREAAQKAGENPPPSNLERVPDEFQRKKSVKMVMDEGRELFKASYKKGIRFFWENGMCAKDEAAVALFLHQTPGMDKTMLGEFLGERYDFDDFSAQKMMGHYARLFDFRGMEVDLALRLYLATFRLPGEGQKVSRIMEQFSAKYYEDTIDTNLFGNPDAVYYLSMAITMLTTSIHNPSVAAADKLTLQSWKKLLLGQNAEKDYDDTMIDGIFARIFAEEFKVRGEEPPAPAANSTPTQLGDKQKLQLFLTEAKAMSDKTKESIKERYTEVQAFVRESRASRQLDASSDSVISMSPSSPSPIDNQVLGLATSTEAAPSSFALESFAASHPLSFVRASAPQIADQMVQATALALLSTFISYFESTMDLKTVAMCLEGMRGGVRLSCLFNLKVEREAYVNAIAQLTLLESSPSKEIKPKHIEALNALLTVAEEEGNLGESWKRLLGCISPLEKLLSTPQSSSKPNLSSSAQVNNDDDHVPSADELNAATLSSKIRSISIDRIFTNSSRLSDEAITDFVAALCHVSKSELLAPALSNQTRTFSLQKLVEVADFNISRPKYVWMTIWNSVSAHFTEAGLHRAFHVALVAVDSLRQVSSKLLERHTTVPTEGGQFQVALLAPFESMYSNPNPDVRDYLICCLAKLMATHFKSVHAGWPAIFSVLVRSSCDTPALVELGLHQLESIKTSYFASVVESEHFADYVQTISKFCVNPNISEKHAAQAIALLKFCAQQLATGELKMPSILVDLENEVPPSEVELHLPADSPSTILFTSRPAHRGQWFPLLKGFTQTLEQHDINTRPVALAALFETLNSCGQLFSRKLFKSIFTDIIFPVFDRVLKPAMTQLVIEDTDWLLTTCHKFLHGAIILFCNFFDTIGSDLLEEILALLSRLTLQNNEKLATFGITCLETLLTSTASKFDSNMWKLVMDSVSNIMKQNMPAKLKVVAPTPSLSTVPSFVDSEASSGSTTSADSISINAPDGVVVVAPASTAPSKPVSQPNHTNQAASAHHHIANRLGRQGTGLSRSTSVRKVDPRKKILLGKAWIQNSALKTIRECLIDGSQANEMINKLEPRFIAQLLDIYLDSFVYAYKVLRDPNLSKEDKMEQDLYDLVLKQEIDSMWTYTEVVFALYNEHSALIVGGQGGPNSEEIVKLVDARILSTFALLEQAHMILAQQVGTLSERRKRLHESNEALVIGFLTNILAFSDDTFLLFLPRMYAPFIRLTLSDSIKVREAIRDVLGRVGILKLGVSKDAISGSSLSALDLSETPEDSLVSPPTSPRVSPKRKRLAESTIDPEAEASSQPSTNPATPAAVALVIAKVEVPVDDPSPSPSVEQASESSPSIPSVPEPETQPEPMETDISTANGDQQEQASEVSE